MKTIVKNLSGKGLAWLCCLSLLAALFCLPAGAAEGYKPTNMAQGKEAWASSNDRGNHENKPLSVRFLTDGSDTNFIVSHEEDEQPWFYVNLGQSYRVSRVELCWGGTVEPYTNAYATRYALQVSDTGAEGSWQTIKTVTDGAREDRVLEFEAVEAQYVRVAVEEKNGRYAALREMRVYEAADDDTGNDGEETDPVRVLFIGNSHTYKNNVPAIVSDLFKEQDWPAVCDSLAIESLGVGGKTLQWHYQQGRTALTILNGHYDYVVLQENASLFDDATFTQGYALLRDVIRRAGAQPLLYMIWSNESKPEFQKTITKTYVREAQKSGARLAAAGVAWDIIRHNHTDIQLYQGDGNHALPIGSYLAASSLYYAITGSNRKITVPENDALATRLGVKVADCQLMQDTAFRVAQEGYDVVQELYNYDPQTDNEPAPEPYPIPVEEPTAVETLAHWGEAETTYDTLLYGKQMDLGWKMADEQSGSGDGVDLSGQAVNGAHLDYDLMATVTLTPLEGTNSADIRDIWSKMTFRLRSKNTGTERKSNEFSINPRDVDGANRFTLRIPLLAIGAGNIDWAHVQELQVRCELNSAYYQRNEDGSEPGAMANPYFTLKLEDVRVVNTSVASVPPDRTALDAAIADAGTVQQDGKVYTDKTISALAEALKAAQNLPATADQKAIDAAADRLNDALAALRYALGDVDGSGRVDIVDALMTLQAAAETITLTDIEKQAAHVDGDDRVTAGDALSILQRATGRITKFAVEE